MLKTISIRLYALKMHLRIILVQFRKVILLDDAIVVKNDGFFTDSSFEKRLFSVYDNRKLLKKFL